MSAREDILERITQSLSVSAGNQVRADAVMKRIDEHPRHTVPVRGQLELDGRTDLLIEILQGQSASIAQVKKTKDVPGAISVYLRDHNLGSELRIGDNAALGALDWDGANLDISRGAADTHTKTGCSTAFCAIAESGTLVLRSGADNPTTLNYLPDTHIVILDRDDILASYEEAWDKMRVAGGNIPRNVNYISGPSRTADIEQTIFLGAHGPRRLHVVIVK